jgi:hypothetical protein
MLFHDLAGLIERAGHAPGITLQDLHVLLAGTPHGLLGAWPGFDPTTVDPLLVAAPIGVGLAGLAGFAWWKRDKRLRDRKAEFIARAEQARAATAPPGTVSISMRGTHPAGDRSGRIMLLLCGTFAENTGDDLLTLLEGSGLEGAIGSVLLIEADQRRRQRFLESVPATFRGRIVAVEFPGLAGGFGNRTPQAVLAQIGRWGPAVMDGATEACERHQRLQRGEEAALVLAFISQGGGAIAGTLAVKAIAKQFRMAKFFGFTALPVDDELRRRAEYVLDEYRTVGVHGFVGSDNLGDEVAHDFGMVGTIAGFAAAAEYEDAAVELNNALQLLFGAAPGGLVSYSTYLRTIPGYPVEPRDPAVPARYFVYRNSLLSAIHSGLEEVQGREYHALGGHGLDGRVPLTSRFDLVLAAVVPEDLRRDEDTVVLGQELRGVDKRNYHLLFAPIATRIDSQRPLCPVAVISLRALRNPRVALRGLTQAPVGPVVLNGSVNGHGGTPGREQEVSA